MSTLHEKALEIVSRYKKVESELLEILEKIEREKIYLPMGFGSLFAYTVQALALSESVAYNFINVMRKSREVPELKVAIEAGSITVSKARKITSVLTPKNQKEWIAKAQELPLKVLEKEVAKLNPMASVKERARYVTENRISLNFAVSEECFEQLKRAQNLESKRRKKSVSMEEAIDTMVECYLKKNDPILKAKRILAKTNKEKDQQLSRTVDGRYIPALTKHKVQERDKGQCQYKQCGSSRFTEIHHLQPLTLGGSHDSTNLTTLCSAHHKMMHRFEEYFAPY